MKKMIVALLSLTVLILGTACGAQAPSAKKDATAPKAQAAAESNAKAGAPVKLKITANGKTLTAVMEDNPTVQAFTKKLPVTLPMENLYGREMCYRYGGGTFPTGQLRSDGYQVGDIAYWPPRGSLVILFAQNGEHFERQHLGHINESVSFFHNAGDVKVNFELAKE